MDIDKELLNMLERLPKENLNEVKDFIQEVLDDPNFTKVTPEQAIELEQIKLDMNNGEYFTHEEVFGK